MNSRNPTDDFFQRRLEDYEQEAPLHLWDEIDRRRPWVHRLHRRVQRNRSMILLLLFLLASTLLGLLWRPEQPPALRSFPIPGADAAPVAARQSLNPAPLLPNRMPANLRLASIRPAEASEKPPLPAVSLPSPKTDAVALSERPRPVASTPPVHRSSLTGAPRSLPTFALVLPEQDPQCVRFGKPHRWRFYTDLSVGPSFPFRQLKARSEEYSAYAQARKDTESPQLSYHAQLRLSVVTDFGLALRGGISYTQYNEKFDFTDNSEEKITITNVYGPNGDIIGTDTIVEKGMLRQLAQNNYHLLDFPIVLGYEWHRKNWTIAFNGGPVVNMLFSARGQFLSPEDMSPAAFSSDATDTYPAYRRDIGIGWYASVGLHYKLQEDLQLLVEPHFRLNPQSVTRSEYVLNQRYMNTGISIGLRKQI